MIPKEKMKVDLHQKNTLRSKKPVMTTAREPFTLIKEKHDVNLDREFRSFLKTEHCSSRCIVKGLFKQHYDIEQKKTGIFNSKHLYLL